MKPTDDELLTELVELLRTYPRERQAQLLADCRAWDELLRWDREELPRLLDEMNADHRRSMRAWRWKS
jgi:hypothetical protein